MRISNSLVGHLKRTRPLGGLLRDTLPYFFAYNPTSNPLPRQPVITITTSRGDIVIELFEEAAPISCENFRQYVADGHFTETIFHRVIPNFMIQCGGMNADMSEKETRAAIKNEADNGEKNVRGTLAMARTGVVDSATSQFFINLNDNTFLDHSGRDFGYAVFGRVTDGMDVVDMIAAVATGNNGGHQDVPLEPVLINEVRNEG